MKKFLVVFTILLSSMFMIMCTSKTVTKLTYMGESPNWKGTMIFDENNKYKLNIKYVGQDQLPLEVTLNAELLSGYGFGGTFEYSELTDEKFGGFNFENDYDKKIYGNLSNSKNKDKLKIIIKWNSYEETIELSKVDENESD